MQVHLFLGCLQLNQVLNFFLLALVSHKTTASLNRLLKIAQEVFLFSYQFFNISVPFRWRHFD